METINTSKRLADCGIRPSVQRMQIYEYLLAHRTHPTADEIFEALSPQMPTLSKTTVYNTLALFVEKKLVLALTLDDRNMRYDAYTHQHAHFFCQDCGKVYDVEQDKSVTLNIPVGFRLLHTEISHFGICSNCSEQSIQ